MFGDRDLISASDLADLAGVSAAWVRRLCVYETLAATKIGKVWYVPRDEARRWLVERGVTVPGGERPDQVDDSLAEPDLRISLGELRPGEFGDMLNPGPIAQSDDGISVVPERHVAIVAAAGRPIVGRPTDWGPSEREIAEGFYDVRAPVVGRRSSGNNTCLVVALAVVLSAVALAVVVLLASMKGVLW